VPATDVHQAREVAVCPVGRTGGGSRHRRSRRGGRASRAGQCHHCGEHTEYVRKSGHQSAIFKLHRRARKSRDLWSKFSEPLRVHNNIATHTSAKAEIKRFGDRLDELQAVDLRVAVVGVVITTVDVTLNFFA